MGKRQGPKKENKQLWGRAALAGALWHSAPHPKPYLIFVASDRHGPHHTPDADVVKSLLIRQLEVPADYIITRQRANCTLLEVRTAQVIGRAYKLANLFAVTHLYHAARSQRYFAEIAANIAVIPAHPAILAEISFPPELMDLQETINQMVAESMPGKFDLLREYVIEWLLGQAHTLDRRGKLERRLAKLLRPNSYR